MTSAKQKSKVPISFFVITCEQLGSLFLFFKWQQKFTNLSDPAYGRKTGILLRERSLLKRELTVTEILYEKHNSEDSSYKSAQLTKMAGDEKLLMTSLVFILYRRAG